VFSNPEFDYDGAGSVFEHVPIDVLNTCVGHAMPNMLSMNLMLDYYPEETYYAQVVNLNIFQPSNPSFPVTLSLESTMSPDNDADCPSLIFYIARWSPIPDSEGFSLDYTALSCQQVVDEIQVNATLLYPSMELTPQHPPSVLWTPTITVLSKPGKLDFSSTNGKIRMLKLFFLQAARG
jgi:hypothetical protein